MAPGSDVDRANCASYNGCTWRSTRIISWTVTIYYVHHWHSNGQWSSANVYLLCWWHTCILSHESRQNSGVKGMVENCISHVHRWLASNRLWLNSDKTEVMWCLSARRASTFDQPSLTIGYSTISPSNVVRDLGVQLRVDLSVAFQVSKVVHRCYYNIRQLRTIRSSLTPDALRDAAYALILTRLDYCNALYLNDTICELHLLQTLINTAACVISGLSRFDHITDFVKDVLHWLPITQRVHFKMCTLVYKASRGLAPTYVSDLVVKINSDPSTLWLAVISTLATNSSYTLSTVRRMCFCCWWSNTMEFATWCSLRCDIINNISSSTKGTFVYHHVWKLLCWL